MGTRTINRWRDNNCISIDGSIKKMATVYKVLGQVAPANTSNTNLYTVGALKQAVVSTLHVANVSTGADTFDVFVRIAGAAAGNSNAIAKDVPIAANSILAITTGMTLNAADIVTVRSSTANDLTFTLFGSEIDV
jgi:hypothetical protein